MDLTRLTHEDLQRLQGELRTVATAADALAEGDMEPEISLTDEATIIRARPITGVGSDPVLILPGDALPIEIEPDNFEAIEAAPVAEEFAAPAPLNAQPAPSRRAARKDAVPAAELKTGPLDDSERAEILRRHRAGEGNKVIAAALARRVQTVGLFIESGMRKAIRVEAAPASEKPGQPAPSEGQGAQDPGEAATDDVAPETFAPVAGSAKEEILGGDQGGLQRESLAEHDPVQAMGGGERSGNAASAPSLAEAPPGLSVLGRMIWGHLAALPCPRGWDVEMDLDMMEAFGIGQKAAQIALDLDVDARAVVDRHRALTEPIRDSRGQLPIDDQTTLIRVLREFIRVRRQGGAD